MPNHLTTYPATRAQAKARAIAVARPDFRLHCLMAAHTALVLSLLWLLS